MPKKYQTLPSTAVKELCKRHTAAKVGEMLGVAESTIHAARHNEACSHPLELAARYVLSKEDRQNGAKNLLAICRIPAEKKQVFEAFMRGMELKWTWFKEDE